MMKVLEIKLEMPKVCCIFILYFQYMAMLNTQLFLIIPIFFSCFYFFGLFIGGHLNPSVTLAMSVVGRLPWRKLPFYWGGQTIGAFLASSLAYGIYYGKFLFLLIQL